MNEVKIVEWGHYKIQWYFEFTEDLYLIKRRKIKSWFREVDWIVWSSFKDWTYEQIMTLKKFKSIVLYKVN